MAFLFGEGGDYPHEGCDEVLKEGCAWSFLGLDEREKVVDASESVYPWKQMAARPERYRHDAAAHSRASTLASPPYCFRFEMCNPVAKNRPIFANQLIISFPRFLRGKGRDASPRRSRVPLIYPFHPCDPW